MANEEQAQVILTVDITGLRNLQGRFAAMTDGGLLELQTAAAEGMADELAEVYRRNAPRGSEESAGDTRTERFSESIAGEAVATEIGFELSVATRQPDLERWLREGTGEFGPHGTPITPKNSTFLHFTAYGQEWFLTSVRGMHPNRWEERALAEAYPVAMTLGNKIGATTALALSDDEG